MIAVIKTGGKQYLVFPGKKITIEKLEVKPGEKVAFEEVLFFEDDKGESLIGNPYLEGVKVEGEVLEEGKGEKKIIFKHKKRKRYKVKKGHRQPYTEVEIKTIKLGSGSPQKKSTAQSKKKSTSQKESPAEEKQA